MTISDTATLPDWSRPLSARPTGYSLATLLDWSRPPHTTRLQLARTMRASGCASHYARKLAVLVCAEELELVPRYATLSLYSRCSCYTRFAR